MNNQPTQMAQIQQHNERLLHEAMQLKARIFDAENALGNLQRNTQALAQEAQLLASILNEDASLELRRKLVRVAPSFGDMIVTAEPVPKEAPAPTAVAQAVAQAVATEAAVQDVPPLAVIPVPEGE